LRRINIGLRRRKKDAKDGFWLDTATGEWLSETKAADIAEGSDLASADSARSKQRVIPYVEDRRNVLLVRFAETLRVDAMANAAASAMYALERGIEAYFQLEDSELTSELMPDPDHRGRALFVESAEGGAGVLRRLVDEPHAFAHVARTALEIAHFDPNTGEDVAGGGTDGCVQACYECLLSYGNQTHHRVIDRRLVRDLLMGLAHATVTRTNLPAIPPIDTAKEGPVGDFVDWLTSNGYRTPHQIGGEVLGTQARPDLVYRLPTGTAAIFVDSPGAPPAAGRDEAAMEALFDQGCSVIRVSVGDWAAAAAKHPSVFGEKRGGAS
jgi:hypothetical protein